MLRVVNDLFLVDKASQTLCLHQVPSHSGIRRLPLPPRRLSCRSPSGRSVKMLKLPQSNLHLRTLN